MSDLDSQPSANLLLASLSIGDLGLLKPILRREMMHRAQVVVSANRPIEYIWFLEAGVASVAAETAGNGRTEIGIIGRKGFSGVPLLLGAANSPHEILIQVNGHSGLQIEAALFLAAPNRSVTLRGTLLRYVQTFITQTALSAVSNAHQRRDARLAHWLLMCPGHNNGDEIHLIHDFMAMMIAAERSGVTILLHVLEGAGMIRSRRGRVLILDRAKLEEQAGDCYGRPEAEYRQLVAPFAKNKLRSMSDKPLYTMASQQDQASTCRCWRLFTCMRISLGGHTGDD